MVEQQIPHSLLGGEEDRLFSCRWVVEDGCVCRAGSCRRTWRGQRSKRVCRAGKRVMYDRVAREADVAPPQKDGVTQRSENRSSMCRCSREACSLSWKKRQEKMSRSLFATWSSIRSLALLYGREGRYCPWCGVDVEVRLVTRRQVPETQSIVTGDRERCARACVSRCVCLCRCV